MKAKWNCPWRWSKLTRELIIFFACTPTLNKHVGTLSKTSVGTLSKYICRNIVKTCRSLVCRNIVKTCRSLVCRNFIKIVCRNFIKNTIYESSSSELIYWFEFVGTSSKSARNVVKWRSWLSNWSPISNKHVGTSSKNK